MHLGRKMSTVQHALKCAATGANAMRPLTACTWIALLALFTVTLAAAESSVEVVFTNPEKFSDASLDSPGYERGADPYAMKQLRSYIQKLGARYHLAEHRSTLRAQTKRSDREPSRRQGHRSVLPATPGARQQK
jgi:hypothetical protein